eukprot:1883658-Prymnesium_polylepis.1
MMGSIGRSGVSFGPPTLTGSISYEGSTFSISCEDLLFLRAPGRAGPGWTSLSKNLVRTPLYVWPMWVTPRPQPPSSLEAKTIAPPSATLLFFSRANVARHSGAHPSSGQRSAGSTVI